jgi:hypothetical protein
MNYPKTLASRTTRAGRYVSLSRYPISGYYEITRETADEYGTYYARTIYDTGREAWAAYKRNGEKN